MSEPWPVYGRDYTPPPRHPAPKPDLYPWAQWGQVVLGAITIMVIGSLLTMIVLLTFAKWYVGHQLDNVLNSSAAIGQASHILNTSGSIPE